MIVQRTFKTMIEPAFAANEIQRVAALHNLHILDTPPEERFERVTRTAARLFKVPIALISLVDTNRQWFKSCQGLNASETPRNISFCGHAILEDKPLIIPDAKLDLRFADNPLVTGEPCIRFYAGRPLATRDGSKIGTLCIISPEPRQMSEVDLQSLNDLAAWAENELNLLNQNEALTLIRDRETRLDTVLNNVVDGILTLNDSGTLESFNRSAERIFGYSAAEILGQSVTRLIPAFYHSQDEGYFIQHEQAGVAGIGRELVGQRKDGSLFPLDFAFSEMQLFERDLYIAICRDITERKQAEDKLRESEQRLRTVINNAPIILFTINLEEVITLSEGKGLEALGMKSGFGVGYRISTIYHDRPDMLEYVRRALTGESFTLTYELGGVILESCYSPLLDEKGELCGTIGVSFDITERKQIEETLKKSEEKYRSIITAMEEGIVLQDSEGVILSSNASAERILGLTVDQMMGRSSLNSSWQAVHEDGSPFEGETHPAMATLQTGQPYSNVIMGVYKPDATLTWVSINSQPLFQANEPKPYAVVCSFTDITERKWTQEALRESEERFRRLSDATLEGIMIHENGKVLDTNQTVLDMFGYESADFLSVPTLDSVAPEYRELVRGKIMAGDEKTYEAVAVRKDGSHFPIEVRGRVIPYHGRKIRVTTIRDITERQAIERMKKEFISTVSHELRTPLTSIRGSLGLIMGGVAGEIPTQAKTMLDIAYKNSERLVFLINDILDIEKIEAGKMEFNLKPTELLPLIEQTLEANRAYGEQYGVKYILGTTLPGVKVTADSDRLMQVLANLLSNAAKFSPTDSTVVISMSPQKAFIRVCVTDQGAGISTDFHSRIFQKFAQADASNTRQKGGSGLGLSITRAIVERMGGQIDFKTSEGGGTTFYFDLPRYVEKDEVPVEVKLSNRPRILVCEDNQDIATLLSMILDQGGFAVTTAPNAERAKQLLAQQLFAAMTLDIMLPGQDGISLLRELRSDERTRDLPIVVVSGLAEPSQQELTGYAVAVIDWIDKPINNLRLIEAVKRATHQHRTAHRLPRILHVEDDPDILQVVSLLLNTVGEVVPASSLQEAKQRLQEEIFDLVILDLELPDGFGLDLLAHLSNPNKPPPPIVIFSAREIGHETVRQETIQQVAATLVKSRTSNQALLDTIKSLIQ